MNKLKLKRTSVMPNKYGSYAYEILDAAKPEVAEFLTTVAGVYDGAQGGKVLFSLNRLGETNKPFMADIRTQKSTANDENYIQLVDNSLDALATVGAGYKAAERFGTGFAATYASIGLQKMFEGSSKPVAAPVAVKEKVNTETNTGGGEQNGGGPEIPAEVTNLAGGGGEDEPEE